MAKRQRRAKAGKKTASKRGKGRAQVTPSRKKAAKRAGRKKGVKKLAKRTAVKTKTKKLTTKTRVKRAAPKKAAPQQPAPATEETVVVDIIEEPVPGVVVVTEIEAVETTALPDVEEGSDLAEGRDEKHQ
jgi:hypothetical protein